MALQTYLQKVGEQFYQWNIIRCICAEAKQTQICRLFNFLTSLNQDRFFWKVENIIGEIEEEEIKKVGTSFGTTWAHLAHTGVTSEWWLDKPARLSISWFASDSICQPQPK